MKAAEMRNKTLADLQKELAKQREKLVQMMRERRTNDSLKPHEPKVLRQDIAKILTVINEKQREES